MAIHHGYARAGGTDAHRQRLQASRGDLTEDFADLAPDFLFFLGDIGNNIIKDVEAEYPPLRPAPETACSDVMTTVSSPKVLTNGAREIANPTVVQLGFGEINPFQPRCWRCCST